VLCDVGDVMFIPIEPGQVTIHAFSIYPHCIYTLLDQFISPCQEISRMPSP
jgi:hypothetical protein